MREAERRRGEFLKGRSWRARKLTERGRGGGGGGDACGVVEGGAGRGERGEVAVRVAPAVAVVPVRRLSEAAAARRIAGYWLLSRARERLRRARLLPGAPPRFEECAAALQAPAAVGAAADALRALGVRSGGGKLARVLLAAVLFAAFPEHVMEGEGGEGEREREVLWLARWMVACLREGTLGAVAAAFRVWGRGYEAWRSEDRERLRAAIVKDAMATEGLRDAVRRRYGGGGGGGGEGELAVWERELDGKQAQLRSAMLRLGGEAAAEGLDAELGRARRMPDERIAHEIAVDLEGFLGKLRAVAVPEVVWGRLEEELQRRPVMETRELFARFEKLEIELNAMTSGSFEPVDRASVSEAGCGFAVAFVERAAAALKRSQAQADDAGVDAWLAQATRRIAAADGGALAPAVVAVLRELTARVACVHEAVSVARVAAVAPIVQQHGAAWERARHEDRVRAGEIPGDLPRTRAFLAASCGEVSMAGEARVAYAQALLRAAVVNVCEGSTAVSAESVPEVFLLDVNRLVEFQNDMQRAALAALLDNVARQFLAMRADPAAARALRLDGICRVLLDYSSRLETIQDAVVAAVAACAAATTNALSAGDEAFLRGMVERSVQPGNAMFRLMHSRVSKQVCALLLTTERGPAQGLGAVQADIAELARRMEALATWAWNVHGEALLALASSIGSDGESGPSLTEMED